MLQSQGPADRASPPDVYQHSEHMQRNGNLPAISARRPLPEAP